MTEKFSVSYTEYQTLDICLQMRDRGIEKEKNLFLVAIAQGKLKAEGRES